MKCNVYPFIITVIAAFVAGFVSAKEKTLLSDDLSTLDNFVSTTISGSSWVSNGTDAVHTNGVSSSTRARLDSETVFDLNPGNIAYDSVTLEFVSSSASTTKDRLEVGLIDSKNTAYYNNPLSSKVNVYGAVVSHTSSANPVGLAFNFGTGTAPGENANDISMKAVTGTHTYRIVFTDTGTELFQDGLSQGMTTKVLDFTRDYCVVAYGQGDDSRSAKSLDNVLLTAEKENKLSLVIIH
ncbi:MAG: hypothetical protein AB7E95_00530 [Kiritimatiellales bacterium]